MRIDNVKVKNYRSLRDFEIDVDDYTVLIGSNGAGKSSVLYALDWFFNDYPLATSDLHIAAGGEADESPIEVEVTFSDLTPRDRSRLGRFGRSETACIRRTCLPPGKSGLSATSRQGPGFAEIRNAPNAKERKRLFTALSEELAVGTATSAQEIDDALDQWEEGHEEQLVEVGCDSPGAPASELAMDLGELINFVLIPASSDMAQELEGTAKNSTLGDLVGGLLNQAVSSAREKWQDEHEEQIARLERTMREEVSQVTSEQEELINATLSEFVPGASLGFTTQTPEWRLHGDAALKTTIEIDGARHDVARQGHGVQRAVMMAVLQALAPDAPSSDGQVSSERASLMIAIEEPEIYQHPIRARHFGRTLTRLSERSGTQVLLASHSPYFVRPEQFERLRRVRLLDGASTSVQATVGRVAKAADESPNKVNRRLEVELPKTFSEGFFAETAVLVEGETDKVVIETIAERLDTPLDAEGIAVLIAGGKGSLKLAARLLEALGTRVFIVVDGDARGWRRKDDPKKQADRRSSAKASTDKVLEWLDAATAVFGTPPREFGDATAVGPGYWFLHDDIEHELEQWSEFVNVCADRNVRLRDDKNASAYRAAAFDAELDNLPPAIREAINAMRRSGAPSGAYGE